MGGLNTLPCLDLSVYTIYVLGGRGCSLRQSWPLSWDEHTDATRISRPAKPTGRTSGRQVHEARYNSTFMEWPNYRIDGLVGDYLHRTLLVSGTGLVKQVALCGGKMFCPSAASINSVATQVSDTQASFMLVLKVGVNDIKNQWSEELKEDYFWATAFRML